MTFPLLAFNIITQMNAIGIVSKAGRYGGIYAYSDIAMLCLSQLGFRLSSSYSIEKLKERRELLRQLAVQEHNVPFVEKE